MNECWKIQKLHKIYLQNDLGCVIFGKEHLGRVRRLLYGACPSLTFKKSTTRLSGMNHASSSASSPNVKRR